MSIFHKEVSILLSLPSLAVLVKVWRIKFANIWIFNYNSIVFSCWTRTLNLIAWHLKRHDIPFERIDGEVSSKQRQTILEDFAADKRKPVLIMTTGTGAFGWVPYPLHMPVYWRSYAPANTDSFRLNLTAANRVFIVEPQWNPSVEDQAIARTIRLGQNSRVFVKKYVVQDSVEKVTIITLPPIHPHETMRLIAQ